MGNRKDSENRIQYYSTENQKGKTKKKKEPSPKIASHQYHHTTEDETTTYRSRQQAKERNHRHTASQSTSYPVGQGEHQQKTTKRLKIAIFCVLMVGFFMSGIIASVQIYGENKENTAVQEVDTAQSDTSATATKQNKDEKVVAAMAELKKGDPGYTMVINRTYKIEPGYIAGTGQLSTVEGKQLETKAAESLKKMLGDLRAQGMDIIVQSGYRTDADQEYLYNRQISRQKGDKIKAATVSALPLTSEHQAGLAVDFSVNGNLDEQFATTSQGQWLDSHCMEYGFILRYTKDKMEITGITWEPWHFRYVGSPETATAISSSGKCMEEFYGQYLATEDLMPYLDYLK